MFVRRLIASIVFMSAAAGAAAAQPPAPGPQPSAPAAPAAESASVGRIGVGLRASTRGFGLEGAVKLHRKANVRLGVNRFNYSRDFDDEDSNITYTGSLALSSIDASFDWFPFGGGFHLSPGMTIRNSSHVALSAVVPAGETIDVDDVEYLSTAANPIRTSGRIAVASTRPTLTLGWGNLVPRTRRFSVPFEIGVVFQGTPTASLAFTGTACEPNGRNCRDMATDPTIQSHIRAEEASLNDDLGLGALRYFPVISIGFGVRF